ncbi:hypothetical protein CPR19088_GLDEOEPO_01383 [Companilactobacillus paralimentarius]|uniref:hypothetical protein n=1 Tax=Companilactobacillus zhachilii TaxID=2304606 RepID=UPI0014235143|nr:hypothetical protein [Companilactobacillus zhachilii]
MDISKIAKELDALRDKSMVDLNFFWKPPFKLFSQYTNLAILTALKAYHEQNHQ